MRILFSPILVSVTGSILPQRFSEYAQLYMDSSEPGPEALKDAANHSQTRAAIKLLPEFTADLQEKPNFLSSLFKDDESARWIQRLEAEPGELKLNLFTSAKKFIEDIKQDPEKQFIRLQAKIDREVENDKALVAGLAYKHPNDIEREISKAKLPRDDKAVLAEKNKLAKNIMGQAIGRLPPILKRAVEHSDMTIALLPVVMTQDQLSLGASNFVNHTILLDSALLDNPPLLDRVLKEEVMHYFDYALGFSRREGFKQAAQKLLADADRMPALRALSAEIHGGKESKFDYYDKGWHAIELLAEYHHIRDFLAEKQTKRGCSPLKWVISTNSARASAALDAQMEKIFGPEFHAQAKQFMDEVEKTLPPQQITERTR